jgi:hypothetical protein
MEAKNRQAEKACSSYGKMAGSLYKMATHVDRVAIDRWQHDI